VPLESRVKKLESLFEKLERKTMALEHVVDLDDFVGVRIILLFKRDLEKVTLNRYEQIPVDEAQLSSSVRAVVVEMVLRLLQPEAPAAGSASQEAPQ